MAKQLSSSQQQALSDEVAAKFKSKISSVAKTLLEEFLGIPGIDPAKLPTDKKDIMRVIERILASNLLNWTVMPAGLTPALVRTVVRMIKLQLGMGNSDVMDLDFITSFLSRCNGSTSSDSSGDPLSLPRTRMNVTPAQIPEKPGGDPSRRKRLMIYRIEGNLPPIVDAPGDDSAAQLLDEAFDRWTMVTRLLVQSEEVAGKAANVIIKSVMTDGSGGELARATLGGGPGTIQNYSLLIDSSDTWTAQKFLATTTHEIGHMLGLDHSENPQDLMFPTLAQGRTADLTDGDIRRAQRDWGAPT
jgi:hypothetical protein